MVYTQLADRKKAGCSLKTDKILHIFSVFLNLWFSCENCYDKPNEIKFYRPPKWGVVIGKGVTVLWHGRAVRQEVDRLTAARVSFVIITVILLQKICFKR